MKLCRALCWGIALGIAVGGDPIQAAAKKSDAADQDSGSSKKKEDPDTHVVKRGETLWGIARKYDVSVGELMDLNHMQNDKVHEGQTLKIPQPGVSIPLTPPEPSVYVVKKGDTLHSIARAHHLSQDELEHANPKADPDHPKLGSKLKIPVPASDVADKDALGDHAAKTPVKYVVKEDDTYHSIAKAHGLTSKAIAKANPDVDEDRLRPGTKLVLPPKPAKDSGDSDKKKEATTDGEEKPVAKLEDTHHYVIGHGEDAESIADAFGISVKQLCKINGGKSVGSFKAGSEILVPNDR